jgi:hypothetical protein
MTGIKGALGPAVAIFAATLPLLGFAQSSGVVRDITRPAAGTSAPVDTLAPAEIVAQVQRAGFDPISGPVQRGRVYVLFALDPNDRHVKLTVDAASGSVLWVTGIAGTRYGDPGYYGYRAWWRYERPPVPPAAIPNMGPGWNNFRPVTRDASVRPSPPLPRTRPASLAGATPVRSEPQAAAAPVPPVTMVPVAPLE